MFKLKNFKQKLLQSNSRKHFSTPNDNETNIKLFDGENIQILVKYSQV